MDEVNADRAPLLEPEAVHTPVGVGHTYVLTERVLDTHEC